MSRINSKVFTERSAFAGLVALLVLTFLTGGGARDDIQSLAILRPAAVAFCAFGLWNLKRHHVKGYAAEYGLMAVVLLYVALYLVPLPTAVWAMLPGREIISEIDAAAGIGAIWRPASLSPAGTWNALYALAVPLAVLILGSQLNREQRFRLVYVMLAIGLLSGILGLVQSVGDPQGPLYFYRITNSGMAVGLFANRNHQAVFLATLFPMLAIFASANVTSEEKGKLRAWLAIAVGALLIPLLLVTGSRAGLLAGVVALAISAFIYRKPASTVPKKRKVVKFDIRYPLFGFGLLCLGALTALMSRAESLQRLVDTGGEEEVRFKIWPKVLAMSDIYFPVGSGIGTFVPVYKIHEARENLTFLYLNHVHNEWLELWMTGGVLAAVLVVAAGFYIGRAILSSFLNGDSRKRDDRFRRLGAAVILLLAAASTADYPLRTPSLAALFMLALIWLKGDTSGIRQDGKRDGGDLPSPLAL